MKKLSILIVLLPFLVVCSARADKIDSLRNAFDLSSGIERIKILNQLSEAIVYTNPGESLEIGQQAYELAEKQNDESEKYRALKNIGYANGYLGNFTESIENMEDGLVYYQSIGDSVKIAEALSDIGYLKIALSDFLAGAELYRQALSIREKINDPKGISYSLNNLGALYWQWNKPDDALYYYQQSIPFLKENNLTEEIATVLGNIGVIYKEKGDFEEALEYSFESLELFKQMNHNIGIAKMQSNIAIVYIEQGKLDEALQLLQMSAKIREKIGDKEGLSLAYHNTGSVLRKMNQPYKAIEFFKKSESISKEIGSKALLLKNYEELADVYREKENYKLAYEFLKKEKNLNDSIYNAESHRQIEELKTKYDSEKKALEIMTLLQKNESQQLTLKKRQIYIYVILIVAAFALLQVHLSYIRRKAILQRKTISLEQKLLRLQMNPHFIFNSISAIQSYIFNNSKKDAVNYLSSFASLMRLILENSATEFIPFEKEKKTLDFYLQLQSLRYPGKFDYSIVVDEEIDPENILIPPMLGQPFIENAIEHGLKNISEKGMIEIRYCLKSENVIFEVEDNGRGFNSSGNSNNGNHKSMAIGITKDRLAILNRKQKIKLSFDIFDKSEVENGHGTIVKFTIPVKKQF